LPSAGIVSADSGACDPAKAERLHCEPELQSFCPEADLDDNWVQYLCAIENTPRLSSDCLEFLRTECGNTKPINWEVENEAPDDAPRDELQPLASAQAVTYYRISKSTWVTYTLIIPYPAESVINKIHRRIDSLGWKSVKLSAEEGSWRMLQSSRGGVTFTHRASWTKGTVKDLKQAQALEYYLEYDGRTSEGDSPPSAILHVFVKYLKNDRDDFSE